MRTIINTPRLRLREMSTDDLDFVAEMLGDPKVMRYWPSPMNRDEAAEWVARHQRGYAAHGHSHWIAEQCDSGVPIGQVGLLMCEVDGEAQPALAYMIHHPYWQQGYAREAAHATIEWALAPERYAYVLCLVRPENTPSLRLALKLGFEPVGYTIYKEIGHAVLRIDR